MKPIIALSWNSQEFTSATVNLLEGTDMYPNNGNRVSNLKRAADGLPLQHISKSRELSLDVGNRYPLKKGVLRKEEQDQTG